jgi:multiple sugar transport system ATP-binding protein
VGAVAEIVLVTLTKVYADGTVAVRDVGLDIADGEFLILVGPSGCGKSTTLNMIAGLEDITSGDLFIDGDRVNDKAPRERDIAMVFQSYALYPHMTVRENMAFPLRLAKLDKKTIEQKVNWAAEMLELKPFLNRKPANLSGGQRQRVAMGRAIVRNPKAFLMDEPLSNLDAKLRVQMRTTLARLQRRLGTTTVYVTHDQTEAMTLGDRLVVMRSGVVQQVGSPQELYDGPVNLFVAGFIGSPSMNFLHAAAADGTLDTAVGDIPLPEWVRKRLETEEMPRELILGIRPEHIEDAALVEEHVRPYGVEFSAPVDLVESMGAEKYAYLPLEGERASTAELEELAADAGAADLPSAGAQLVTRLPGESTVAEGGLFRLWFSLDRIYLFDPATGRNLTFPGRGRPEVRSDLGSGPPRAAPAT